MINLYSHNQYAYEKVLFDWKTTNKTCIVHATGTGKSLIIAKIILENPNAKCLFLAPNIFILNQIKKHLNKKDTNVNFYTYQYFLKNAVDDFIDYSYIFLDEFHRVGAPEWNKNIVDILNNNPKAKILGTTATHIRYLDDNRDMAEELFNNSISSYIDLGTSIEKGIHKKPKYVTAIYNISEIIDNTIVKLRKFKKEKEVEKLQSKRILWEQSNGIDFIINKYLGSERKKILIFCKSKEHIDEIEKLIKPILIKFYNENVQFYTIFHLIGQRKNIKILNHFKDAEMPQVIFSVDMLNEGIHVDGVDTIMMFRDTVSPIIYFQQLGRAFLSGQKTEPLIFDFVNNFNVKNSVNNLNSEFYNDFNLKNTNDYFVKERNLIIDYYDEILDFYNFIEKFKINNWEESYQELKQFIRENNRLPKQKEFYWLETQKENYRKGKLTKEQIQLLLKLIPDIFERKILSWEERYYELKQLIRENNILLTQTELWWLKRQKQYYKKGKLSEEQIQLLLKLDPNIFESKILSWEESYEALKQFIYKNNRFPIQKEFTWINEQKQNYKKGMLSEERIQLLLKLDPNFFNEKKRILTWEENYKKLKQFVKKNNILPKQKEFTWIITQKEYYKKGKLSEERIQLLLKLDPDFFITKKSWEERYYELKQFIHENNRLPKNREFSWLVDQKEYYKKGNLSEEKIQLLLKLVPDIFEKSN